MDDDDAKQQVWTDIAWSVCFFASGDWLMDARTYSKHGGVWQDQRWYGSPSCCFYRLSSVIMAVPSGQPV